MAAGTEPPPRSARPTPLRCLETSARVGGAFIVDVIEAASGLNLWREWAHVEIAGEDTSYHVPAFGDRYAGIVLTLAREPHPDTRAFDAPEIVRRIDRRHHAGLIVASNDPARLDELLEEYAERFRVEFIASMPAAESPTRDARPSGGAPTP